MIYFKYCQEKLTKKMSESKVSDRGLLPKDVEDLEKPGIFVVVAHDLGALREDVQEIVAIFETYNLAHTFIDECCNDRDYQYYINSYPLLTKRDQFPKNTVYFEDD